MALGLYGQYEHGAGRGLERGAGVTIQQASGNNTFFMANSQYTQAAIAVTSITIANTTGSNRMSMATINFTGAPNVVVGGYVQVLGDTNNMVNGIWKVQTITLNTATFYISGQGTLTTAGSITVAPANANITLEIDGVIDYNEPQNSAGANLNSHCFVFNRIANLKSVRSNVINVNKYGYLISNSWDCEVRDPYMITGSDGVHCTGNTNNFTLSGFKGSTGDDVFAWGATDSPSGYIPIGANGPCNGILVESMLLRASEGRGILIFPSAAYGSASNIRINNLLVDANGANGIQLDSLAADMGVVNDISIDGLSIGGWGGNLPNLIKCGVTGGITINNMTVRNVRTNGVTSYIPANFLQLSVAGSSITNLTIADSSPVFNVNGSQSYALVYVDASTTIDTLNINNVFCNSSGTNAHAYAFIAAAGTLNNVVISGGATNGYGKLNNLGGTLTTFTVCGGHKFAGFTGFEQNVTKIIINGLTLISASAGNLFNFYGTSATYNLFVANLANPNSVALFNYGTTNTINYNNPDGTAPVDITKISRIDGNMVYNSNAAPGSGTINTAGRVQCQGTAALSWKMVRSASGVVTALEY